MKKNWTKEEINSQLKKEAIISIILYLGFFAWWYFTGYGIAEKEGINNYKYIFGIPKWFFLSSIVGYILFSLVTIVVIKVFFKDIPLNDEDIDR